jgi:hypothetical protein
LDSTQSAHLELLAACGLYCGACYHYRASFPGGAHLLQEAARRGRPVQGYTCRGCRSDALYIHAGCAQCQIRACADQRGIPHCGACAQVPCERLLAFRNDGRLHHLPILEQLGDLSRKEPERWLDEQAARWTCECGAPYTWYETTCTRCGAALDSFGPDPLIADG